MLQNSLLLNQRTLQKKKQNEIIEKARKSIEAEKTAALKELKGEFAKLVVQAASKVIKTDIDDKKHQKIIDDFITDLPNQN